MSSLTPSSDLYPVPYQPHPTIRSIADVAHKPYFLERISPDYAYMRITPNTQQTINLKLLGQNIISSIPGDGQPGGVLTATPPVVLSESFWTNLVAAAQEAYQLCQDRFFSDRETVRTRIHQRTSTFPFQGGTREKIFSPALVESFVANQEKGLKQPFAYDGLTSTDDDKPFQVLEFQASMAYLTLFRDMFETYRQALQRDDNQIGDAGLQEAYASLLQIRKVIANGNPIYVMDTNAFDLTGPDKIGHAQALSGTRPITPYNFALKKMNLHFHEGSWYCDVYNPDNEYVGEVHINYLRNRMQQDDVNRLVSNMINAGCKDDDLLHVYRFLCAQSPDGEDLASLNVLVGPHTCLLATKEDLGIMKNGTLTKPQYVRQFGSTLIHNPTAHALYYYLKAHDSKSGHGVEPITIGPCTSYRVEPNHGIQEAIVPRQTSEMFGNTTLPVDLELRLMSPGGIGSQPFTGLTRRGHKKTNVGQTAVKIATLVSNEYPLTVILWADEVKQRFPDLGDKACQDAAFALVGQMIAPYFGWGNIVVAKNQ